MSYEYDVVVIGSGPGGKRVALKLANMGQNVALVEKSQIGGTCLNEGCIPAKLYLESSSCLSKLKHLKDFGLHVENQTFDLKELKAKKSELLEMLRESSQKTIQKNGIDLILGEASFLSENSIKVQDKEYFAKKFIIATGSIHRPHPILALDHELIISSREVFELEKIPNSVLIVGGGAIGCEFATFFNALGVDVHIAEFTSQIIPAEDSDVAKTLERELKKRGIKVSTDANVVSFNKQDSSIEINLKIKQREVKEKYDLVIVSIGRIPNTSNLNLESANVELDRGFIEVNSFLQTSNPNIYALGDVIKTPALAHSAYNEASVVAHNLICKDQIKLSTLIPYVTFTSPQVASVGKNEKTLKEEKIDYKVIKHFYKSSSKAKIKGDDSGFIKLLCESSSNAIVGGSIVGVDATENIHQILLSIYSKMNPSEISKMVFAHPTISESFWEMCE